MRFHEGLNRVKSALKSVQRLKIYLGYSRLSGLQPGGVAVVTSSFSDSIVFR